ncbi:MAG: alpha/beta fold hydrolase [Caldilineaceae bacterium]
MLNFAPHPLLRASTVQTVLAKQLTGRTGWLTQVEQPVLLDAGPDVTGYDARAVRLLGYYVPAYSNERLNTSPNGSPHPTSPKASRGLVMTLHGWCGCSHSTYNMILADVLVRAGFDLFRLNLRDHGPGLHVIPEALNTGAFLGTLIDEAATATQQIAQLAGAKPFYIVGASMGGNFALRLAARHAQTPFNNLRRVIAISPAINPGASTNMLDPHPLYRHYFRSQWLKSLQTKARLYPQTFDFGPLVDIPNVRDMTDWLVQRYTDYADAEDYFSHYAVTNTHIDALTIPTTIITAADDHVIPRADFAALHTHPLLDMHMLPYGGHVGFMQGFPPRHYLPEMVHRYLTIDERAYNE